MKKVYLSRLFAWALVIAMPLWFGSCKKDGDESITPSKSAIVGTWKVTAYKFSPAYDMFGLGQPISDLIGFLKGLPNDAGADAVTCLTESKFTFLDNGKATSVSSSKCDPSTDDLNPLENNPTWKLDGNKLTTTSSAGTDVYEVSLSGNTMKLSQEMQEDTNGDGKKETYTLTMEFVKA